MALGPCLFSIFRLSKTKKYTAYDRFHGNGPYGEIPTKKEPIRTLGFALAYNKYGLLTKCEVKMAGYWPSSFFFPCLGTETESRSINVQKKNETNIQPS